ncbi:PLP-dependent aminotransferase family protein [Paracoccus caeni]|uniref:PLP-dependent aminotransferase family protein n=1 Tax=Paracoccus caeni TaxID=657651 RepID=A0A934SKD0_9RHOB|nr:PLP-dependent aminotransferase family protein [Paracoccus caeni]MBK4216892.1 PLP-dependent aminotransferase family protein [Paracoccus caeni]
MSKASVITDELKAQILAGRFHPGARLPSIREAARLHGVSKNTMAEVYERLAARGLIEPRAGSGMYVTGSRPPPEPVEAPHIEEAISIVSLLRAQLDQNYVLRPGDGRPPPDWMEGVELRRISSRASASRAVDAHGYGSPWGLRPLREWLVRSLAERGIQTGVDGVMLTHGVNHGLDLIIRHHLKPGDTVFVESPGYYPLFAKLALAQVQVVAITRGQDGPDLDEMEAALTRIKPRMFFIQSQAHNPTGTSLSASHAFRLMRLAEAHDFLLVEDDVFADMLPANLPRLAAFGLRDRVLYLGSFSKTLSASLRCGYICGAPGQIADFVNLKMITMVSSSGQVEQMVLDCVSRGQYARHLRKLVARVKASQTASLRALTEAGFAPIVPGSLGFYIWLPLPIETDEEALTAAAFRKGIFLAPSSVFYPERAVIRPPAMRVNVAYGAEEKLIALLRG